MDKMHVPEGVILCESFLSTLHVGTQKMLGSHSDAGLKGFHDFGAHM